jgi:general secretion pathway protein E
MAESIEQADTGLAAALGLTGLGVGDDSQRPRDRRHSLYRELFEAAGLTASEFAERVAAHHGLPRASAPAMLAGRPLVDRFSGRFLRDWAIFPYEAADGGARVALADPSDPRLVETIAWTLDGDVVREVASFEEIDAALRKAGIGEIDAGQPAQPGVGPLAEREEDELDSLRDLASGAPIVRAVNEILEGAVERRGTDVHLEPVRGGLRVRVRIDGILQPVRTFPGDLARAVVSRVKILAGLNIAERRLPQDGRARFKLGAREIDIRVATMPTVHGEAAILRLLERDRRLLGFDGIGFSPRDYAALGSALESTHGMIVVTGPTGSGKTTTLAAALARLNDTTRKILTIEDPVEYEIEGVNQTQVKPQIGLTFVSALRAFLRQDPDVIMVGEMRDGETARIGIQASLTGHLVLTTLHTNTAAAAITRLVDLGVEPFLLTASLRAIVAQRLVRILCPDCRRVGPLDEARWHADPRYGALGIEPGEVMADPVGCDRCAGTGYVGRRAVFEIIVVTEEIGHMIVEGKGERAIEAAARADGMTNMIEDGIRKAREGLTSFEEVLRVTASR